MDTKHWASLRTQLDQALGFTDLGTNNQGRGKRRPEFEDDPGEKDPGKEGAKNHLEKCFSHLTAPNPLGIIMQVLIQQDRQGCEILFF